MRVTMPNGTLQERPLCNARLTICEIDTSIFAILARLPNHLVFRLREEWMAALREPAAEVAQTAIAQGVRDGLTLVPHDATVKVGAHVAFLEIQQATSASRLREALLSSVDLLRPFWCRFDWLHPFYSMDCLKTVEVNEDGSFDTDISYPCYGDRPDLYFKVEQDCHPGGWLTVHQPPVHCNTFWDYCCGTPVRIEVTHPAAVPGPAPSPCTWPYTAGDPASVGSWEALPYTSGVFVVHAAVLHTGKVLMYSGTAEIGLPLESRVWDPDTGAMTAQTFDVDLFCSGHAFLTDGRLLVNGGAGAAARRAYVFDPIAETWTRMSDMTHTRWYPTTITLPDGRVLTISGAGDGQQKVEIYDPAANTWTVRPATADKLLELYPSLHVMPDGKLLYTGTRWAGALPWGAPPPSSLFDPATDTWTGVDDHEVPNRTEAFSVLLPPLPPSEAIEHEHAHEGGEPPPPPPTLSRVLVVGGPGDQRSAEIIDMTEAAPAWRRIGDMNFARTNVSGVLLPDGNVLICAGIDGYKWGPNTPTLAAEMFDPRTETWTVMAAMSTVRQYHSISLLLPDGRVLNTGSVGGPGNIMSMEVYSPPYLFRGPRPRIRSSPIAIGYGAVFTVESPDTCRVRRVSLIRASSITHHTNTDQRFVALAWERHGHCDLQVTAPSNANVAPPGYYMLFVLDDCGVPSVAQLVRVG